ncbi:hypothetical protein J2D73_12005 [Acetobacter sacchari]|uniref:Uncharacterized protein n=1 Tax=Acetobacter sacchari TaxID=2661687 RepID=A0ABS3LX98_9PROT|nr:hypothetical protein [Acetobacter sacchari]MBO1360513.1 hypothetical protein [Acetobacter sacchari]
MTYQGCRAACDDAKRPGGAPYSSLALLTRSGAYKLRHKFRRRAFTPGLPDRAAVDYALSNKHDARKDGTRERQARQKTSAWRGDVG